MQARKVILKSLRALGESILPLVFWVSIIFGFDTPDVAILTILSAILHELGHLLPTVIFSQERKRVRSHLSGFRITGGRGSYAKEIAELAAGPLINIAVFLVMLPFGNAFRGYASLIGSVNLVTGLSNLLPIEGYDGYGIIKKVIEFTGKDGLLAPLEGLSFLLSCALTFFALYLLERFGEGYWIFGVFFTILISKIAKMIKTDFL